MTILQKFIVAGITLLQATRCFSQSDPIHVQVYGFEEGLPHRNVLKVQQDEDGFLWVATTGGLSRFDGHAFLHWSKNCEQEELPFHSIEDLLCASSEKRMWVSGTDGLACFNQEKNIAKTIRPGAGSIAYRQPWRAGNLMQDSIGSIWMVSSMPGDRSCWLQRSRKVAKAGSPEVLADVAKLPDGYPRRPLAQVGNRVFVGAFENEIWVFDLTGRQVEQFEFPAPPTDPSFSRVIQLQTRANGTLYALLDHGQVYYLEPGARRFLRHPLSNVVPDHLHSSAFWVEENGNVWLGGMIAAEHHSGNSPCSSIQPGTALFRYKALEGKLDDFSYYLKKVVQFSVSPRQIFKDRTGVLWVATEFGLVRLVEKDLFTRYLDDGNDCCADGVCSMRGIAEDEAGNIYFSYYNSIHVLNPSTGSLTPLFYPQPKTIGRPFGILYHDGGLWTGEGLRIDLKTLRIDTVIAGLEGAEGVVMPDREGALWFGCARRLCRLEKNRVVDFQDPTGILNGSGFNNITFLLEAKNGQGLWVATMEKGLFKISKSQGVLRHYHTQSKLALPHDRIIALCEVGGYLWIGTAGGLCRLDPASETLLTYKTGQGLPNDFINGILPEGDSAVWVSTDNGLSRLDIRTGTFTNFFQADGLSKNEFNRISFLRARDGRLYFGGINGVNAFYPSARHAGKQSGEKMRMLLTEFSKFDGEKDFHQNWGLPHGRNAHERPIELSYQDKMFTFWFSLADYTAPHLHLYSYRLDSPNTGKQEWSKPLPVNYARFFNITPGRYTLRVRACRGGGHWAADELAIPIVIHQAFYKTGWFHLLALGLVAIAGYGITRYRLYRANMHERELETQVKQRTQELESEKKKSEDLLLNILPADTAEELKRYGSAKARRFDNVTVMFTDFKEFTLLAASMEPEQLVREIHHCFSTFDEIMEMYGLEKIKTVGDAYLCAGGIGHNSRNSAVQVVKAALEIQAFMKTLALERKEQGAPFFETRIGIHTGHIVAGVVGVKKFAYDIWGDTVNIAERLQANGEVGKVNISKSTYEMVKDHFRCQYRGKIVAKHKGEVDMYFVEGPGTSLS